MPTSRPHPTPQNRQGVFFHVTPCNSGSVFTGAAKLRIGKIVSATGRVDAVTISFNNSRRSIIGASFWFVFECPLSPFLKTL